MNVMETYYPLLSSSAGFHSDFQEKVELYGKFTNNLCSICKLQQKTLKLRDCKEEEKNESLFTHYFCSDCVRLIGEKFCTDEKDYKKAKTYVCDSCLSIHNRGIMISFIHNCRTHKVQFTDTHIQFQADKELYEPYYLGILMPCTLCNKPFTVRELLKPNIECRNVTSYKCISINKCCDHYFCKKCLTNYVENLINKNQFVDADTVPCPSSTLTTKIDIRTKKEIRETSSCTENIREPTLQLLPAKLYNELQKRRDQFNISCLKCKTKGKCAQYTTKKYICQNCNQEHCRICKKKYHIGLCKMPERSEILKAMSDCHPCPYCLEVICKNGGCDHIHCVRCGNDFCIICSARRSAIMTHGNIYHRPNCKHYFEYKESLKDYNPLCKECVQYNKVNKCNPNVRCPYPQNLNANNDIPEEELKYFGFD